MYFNKDFIFSVVKHVTYSGKDIQKFYGCSIDSRILKAGEIFVALKGSQVDGHDYVQEAVNRGAQGLIISETRKECLNVLTAAQRAELSIIIVTDTKQALIQLATAWRAQFTYPVVGITGSVGKTSTKELLSLILERAGKKFIASEGNQNTELGIALNILKMRADHEVAVLEMGINKRGEMAKMAALVKPTAGIITGVGHSHMEGLGSVIDIAAEKRDIFKYFKEDNIGIINGDQTILSNISYTHPIIKFGCKTINQIQARKMSVQNHIKFILKIYNKRYAVTLPTNHIGRIYNVLANVAVSYLLDIPYESIIESIQQPFVVKGRFEQLVLKDGKGILIDDCYNASPESMKAALLAFEKLKVPGQKVAVLGDMLELGVNSPFWHRQLGRVLRKISSLQHVILVGVHIKWTKKTAPARLSIEMVASWQEAIERMEQLEGNVAVLVKGSHGMQLNKFVERYVS
ncbi:MAG: UDP-N-acetylmuramoyl-tripeptide--D-alanyl-D-alanine ligase [Candidatus Babeliaceae bacterium]